MQVKRLAKARNIQIIMMQEGLERKTWGAVGKGKNIEASREGALKASLRSLDLSVDKRELIKGL